MAGAIQFAKPGFSWTTAIRKAGCPVWGPCYRTIWKPQWQQTGEKLTLPEVANAIWFQRQV